MIHKYHKVPTEVLAIKFDGNNYDEVISFIGEGSSTKGKGIIIVNTTDGNITVNPNYYVVKSLDSGDMFIYKSDSFEENYVLDEV